MYGVYYKEMYVYILYIYLCLCSIDILFVV